MKNFVGAVIGSGLGLLLAYVVSAAFHSAGMLG